MVECLLMVKWQRKSLVNNWIVHLNFMMIQSHFSMISKAKTTLSIKIGILGDFGVGKNTLKTRYCDDIDYKKDLCEKHIKSKNIDISLQIWSHIGLRDLTMISQLCVIDATVIIFVFDLTKNMSLYGIKAWYKEARKENKVNNRLHFFI